MTMNKASKKWILGLALLCCAVALITPPVLKALAPGGPRMTEIRKEYYRDAAHTQHCGARIRTCQGYILRDGCAEEDPPPEYYDIFVDPCF